jgi:NAD(P)-dependent dehydrogenase (short-subunit alcohol dehydrogenase family)
MDLHLNDKHVLITGGSKGIGLACARVFLQEGAKVSLVSRDQANLDLAKQTLSNEMPSWANRIDVFSADLVNADSALAAVNAAEKAMGAIDVLVNSAGAAKRVIAPELTPARWRDAMDAKFFTYINVMDPVIKRMGERRSGVVVNVIGAGGKVASTVHISGGSANAALMLATAGLAAAYAPMGIRVNAVSAGAIRTLAASGIANFREMLSKGEQAAPLRKNVTIEEVGNAGAFLCSDLASGITGEILYVDAGYNIVGLSL